MGARLLSWERAGHELRRAGAVLVDQHHDRAAPQRAQLVGSQVVDDLAAAPRGEDDAARQELVRDRGGLVDQAARVVAHVQHHARQRSVGLFAQLFDVVE